MAGEKFLKNDGGTITEIVSVQTSTANRIISLDTNGLIPVNMFPAGYGEGVRNLELDTGVTVAIGDLVNIYGASLVRHANATNDTKPAHGFVLANAGPGPAVFVDVYFEGIITGLTALTIGATYFLDDADGKLAVYSALPTAADTILQQVGTAITATTLAFEVSHQWIKLG